MELSPLAGNRALKTQLSQQEEGRGLSHAYILSGPAGSGKHTLARLLCGAMLCTAPVERRPCGHCGPCKKVFSGIHPDVAVISGPAQGKPITVDQVRQLRADAYIRPNEGERKVYLLEGADRMNASAQNAMLKLLEEGPAYAAFFLLTDNAAALLATVRSRCEVLSLSPVSTEEGLDFLRTRFPQLAESAVRQAALRCEGILGRAVKALSADGPEDDSLRQTALQLGKIVAAGDELALAELCISLEKWDRDKLSALLDETILLLRDALVHPGGRWDECDPGRKEAAKALAGGCPPAKLLEHIALLERLRTACGFYVGAGHLAGWMCAGLTGTP